MADDQNGQKAVPGAVARYVPATSRPAVSKDAPPISTKSPEPLAEHVDVFQAAADREAKIRLIMTQKSCTWPEAVAIVDGTPAAVDPLVARVATLEAALSAAGDSLRSANSSISSLSSRLAALEARITDLNNGMGGTADGPVQ